EPLRAGVCGCGKLEATWQLAPAHAKNTGQHSQFSVPKEPHGERAIWAGKGFGATRSYPNFRQQGCVQACVAVLLTVHSSRPPNRYAVRRRLNSSVGRLGQYLAE